MWEIELSTDAQRHLKPLKARDRNTILDAIAEQLAHEPTVPSRNRKQLRPNPLADWELRVGEYRVFYDIEEDRVVVMIIAVGRKDHNKLKIEGEDVQL